MIKKDRQQEIANIQTLVRSVMKYGLHLCRLPKKVHEAVIAKGYLEGEVVDIYYVAMVSKFAEVLAHQTDAAVANKQSNVELSKFIAMAINTAYDGNVNPALNAIDCTLEIQQLRIVYLPSPSLLAIVSLSGSPLDIGGPAEPVQKPVQVEQTGDGKKEVTIKVTL